MSIQVLPLNLCEEYLVVQLESLISQNVSPYYPPQQLSTTVAYSWCTYKEMVELFALLLCFHHGSTKVTDKSNGLCMS